MLIVIVVAESQVYKGLIWYQTKAIQKSVLYKLIVSHSIIRSLGLQDHLNSWRINKRWNIKIGLKRKEKKRGLVLNRNYI